MTDRPSPLTLDQVVNFPLPGMNYPKGLRFSSDGRWLAYLYSPDRSLVNHLYGFNLQTRQHVPLLAPVAGLNEADLSPEEKLRRERARQRDLGVSTYAWSPAGHQVLVPQNGRLWIKPLDAERYELPVAQDKPALDAHFSPDGAWIAYVQDAEICVVASDGKQQPIQVTTGARGTGRTNGLAEYIAQEEMGRSRGYWWSPDSSKIAFVEVDETHIPVYRIMHQGKDVTGETAQEDHRYPFAGQPNAKVRLGVASREGGAVTWMDLDGYDDFYLARVNWLPDGRLAAQIENREQTCLDLVYFDTVSGARRLLLQETSEVWINLHDMFRPLKESHGQYSGFIWASERSGYRHLYIYDAEGRLQRQLTEGEWMVDALTGVDARAGWVYFTGTRESALESHLYRVPLTGGETERLTNAPGMHEIVMDKACHTYADTCSNLETPPSVKLYTAADDVCIATLHEPEQTDVPLIIPRLVTFEDGAGTQFYGLIYDPPQAGDFALPTIVSVYGGPHAQMVQNRWFTTVSMRAQYLAQHGYRVFVMDNRGSARRGLAFEAALRWRMGSVEVADQAAGVKYLTEQGWTDPQRVGIYGWSYGGYMAAMCLLKRPDIFKVAVSGAPAAQWDGYDTHYTERYMGTPESNPDGYAASAVTAHVDGLEGKLMLVHGLIDENVHFRHTARLINALIKARKPYDLLFFPDERHMPRSKADRIYMEERIASYFYQNL